MKTKKSAGKTVNKTKRTAERKSLSDELKKGTDLIPTEEEIRRKALEIYYLRQASGEEGNELDDWLEAESILKAG